MKGDLYKSNIMAQKDPITGVEVLRLTDNKGIYDRPYFTTTQFTADSRYTIFASDFSGTSVVKNPDAPAIGKVGFGELFTLDLLTGNMLQLTQGEAIKMGHGCHAAIAPSGKKAFYYSNEELKEVDLKTLESRTLMRIPYTNFHSLSITNDERYLAFTVVEELPLLAYQFAEINPLSTPGARERFFREPTSLVIRYDLQKNDMHIVTGGHRRMTHVSLKPDDGDYMLYCHEGPWELVQRMWMVRVSTDEHYPLIKQQRNLERAGHEFFTPSGRVGTQYSYRYKADMPFFLFADIYCDYDGKNEERFYYPHTRPAHVSVGPDDLLGVGDRAQLTADTKESDKMVSLIDYNTADHKAEVGILCRHDSSNRKSAHVHPVFTPDGKNIVFSSDKDGQLNIYMAPADRSKVVRSL